MPQPGSQAGGCRSGVSESPQRITGHPSSGMGGKLLKPHLVAPLQLLVRSRSIFQLANHVRSNAACWHQTNNTFHIYHDRSLANSKTCRRASCIHTNQLQRIDSRCRRYNHCTNFVQVLCRRPHGHNEANEFSLIDFMLEMMQCSQLLASPDRCWPDENIGP